MKLRQRHLAQQDFERNKLAREHRERLRACTDAWAAESVDDNKMEAVMGSADAHLRTRARPRSLRRLRVRARPLPRALRVVRRAARAVCAAAALRPQAAAAASAAAVGRRARSAARRSAGVSGAEPRPGDRPRSGGRRAARRADRVLRGRRAPRDALGRGRH
eukprot:2247841-Prymnesium_polylepis.1